MGTQLGPPGREGPAVVCGGLWGPRGPPGPWLRSKGPTSSRFLTGASLRGRQVGLGIPSWMLTGISPGTLRLGARCQQGCPWAASPRVSAFIDHCSRGLRSCLLRPHPGGSPGWSGGLSCAQPRSPWIPPCPSSWPSAGVGSTAHPVPFFLGAWTPAPLSLLSRPSCPSVPQPPGSRTLSCAGWEGCFSATEGRRRGAWEGCAWVGGCVEASGSSGGWAILGHWLHGQWGLGVLLGPPAWGACLKGARQAPRMSHKGWGRGCSGGGWLGSLGREAGTRSLLGLWLLGCPGGLAVVPCMLAADGQDPRCPQATQVFLW